MSITAAHTTLRATIVASLTDLAAAREYAMAYPEAPRPADTNWCPECGGRSAWAAWLPSGVRCTAGYHNVEGVGA